MAFRSASTAIVTPSSSATMPIGPSPNNSPENNLPPNWDALSKNSASSRSPPTRPRPKAASSAPGAPVRTVWSANFASPGPPLWRRPTPYWRTSAPTTTAASLIPPPMPTRIFAACRAASTSPAASPYQRLVNADHTVVLGTHSIALPPLPGHRGYAGETVDLSHQLDGTLRIYRADLLLMALPLPLQEHAQRRPAVIPSAQKRKPKMPRIYNLSGRPALAAVTYSIGVTESRCS